MATGTGKTMTSAAIIKLFLRTGSANRILFLVDRIELENQALKSFSEYLKNDYRTVIFKKNPEDWRKAEIVVSTVQTLLSNNRYKKIFRPTDFDLIISDEAHRSINGNSRAVFEYFLGYKLGLTATPKNYIKNVDAEKMQTNDPRAWERRQLLDTYRIFGCESGDPTFSYSLIDAVNDTDGPYLINPITVDARTKITTQLLSDEGYAVIVNQDEEEEEEQFFAKHFERKFFSDKTNRVFCKTFMENALKDPITGEIGKSIVFAVSRKHATKVVQILNEFANSIYPDKYNSNFAMQITSEIPNVQSYTVNFQNNNLSGWTKFLENYKSSKTRVCVTVGMMTTGYDCQDLLNVVLMRPIFSPTDFVQIKGRGTRMFTFEYERKQNGLDETFEEPKENFKLFDFFGNCEYFEEKYNYDEIIKLPQKVGEKGGIPGDPPVEIDEYKSTIPDPLKFIEETAIGGEGMKIDRKLFEKFEERMQGDEFVKEQYYQNNPAAILKYLEDNIFNKPKDYFTMEKLRRSIGVDRKITLKEILDKIFGVIPHFKSKRELIEEEFERFLQLNEVNTEKYYDIKTFFETYISDKDVRRIIEDKDFQMLSTNSSYTFNDLKNLGSENMQGIVEYIQDNVNINKFAS
jgi:type I restriction enzyme, R subunit